MKYRKRRNGSLIVSGSLAARIPYRKAYPDTGILQGADGRYVRMYRIGEIDPANAGSYDVKAAARKMEEILTALPKDMRFQFVVHNHLADDDLLRESLTADCTHIGEACGEYIDAYNEVVLDNMTIGHNNTRKVLYYVISVEADSVDDANLSFRRAHDEVSRRFKDYYGTRVEELSLVEELEVLYGIFNPLENAFGEKISLKGDTAIDLKNLRFMHMTTKDLVAPHDWNTTRKYIDYSVLGERTGSPVYARAFFINSVPADISPSFVSDMTNVSSRMLFSIIYEPVDTNVGLKEAADAVAQNTTIHRKNKRDTVSDRKNRTQMNIEEEKELGEQAYFDRAAHRLFSEVKATDGRTYLCTMTVVLFADDPEGLNRDTELLHLSAAKFSGNVNPLDLQQCEGLQTSLPLCQNRINCARLLDVTRLSVMSPVGIQDAIRKDGRYLGLNAINDSLILLNRKNNTKRSGLITGTDHPGKTYQMKREAFNTLLSCDDRVHILTNSADYDDFAQKLGGEICDFTIPDIGEMQEGYGLLSSDSAFKGLFMEALTSSLNDREFADTTDKPAFSVCRRLTVHRFANTSELLMLLDAIWNLVLKDKHDGISHQIFVDGADGLLMQQAAAEYFEGLLDKCSRFQTVVTFVLDGCVKLMNQPVSAVALERIVRGLGYVKLLNLGPVERKKFAEILNLPNALLPYVNNVEPGKGIIVTPASNIAFNDNYNELYPDNTFKDLFAREVKQVGL